MEQTSPGAPALPAEHTDAQRREVEAQIIELVAHLLPGEGAGVTLSPETMLSELGLSSLELTMLTFDIEEKWSLNIKDAYLDDYRTIAEACELVLRLKGLAPDGSAG